MTTTLDLIRASSAIVSDLEESAGEVTPAIEAALSALGDAVPSKLEALFHIQMRLNAEAQLLDQECSRLRARAATLDKGRDRIKAMATELLQGARSLGLTDGNRLRTPTLTAWLQESTSVEGPDDPAEWPEEWRRTRTTVEPDRTKAKADIDAGATSTVVRIAKRDGIRWR